MKWIIHFGTPKTGSTSLQETLFRNRRTLLKRRILYPKVNNQRRHHLLTGLFQAGDKIHPALIDQFGSETQVRRAAETAWEEVLQQIQRNKPDTVILSSEMFVFSACPNELVKLRDRLFEVSRDVTAVLYVRSPAPYYLSALQQRVRSGSIPAPHSFEFRPAIEAIERTFEEVIVRPFDRHSLQDGDIVKDIFSTVLREPQMTSLKTVSLNESFSAEAMSIVLGYRRARLPGREGIPHASCNLLLQKLRRIEVAQGRVGRPRLREEVENTIVRASTDLLWLREQYGIKFPDIDYSRIGTVGIEGLAKYCTVEEICAVDVTWRTNLLYAVLDATLETDMQLEDLERLLPARKCISIASKGTRYIAASVRNVRNAIR